MSSKPSEQLTELLREAHLGLHVVPDNVISMVLFYNVLDENDRVVYHGDIMETVAFINGCKYIREIYEGC